MSMWFDSSEPLRTKECLAVKLGANAFRGSTYLAEDS